MSKPNFKYQEIMDSLAVDCPSDEFFQKETIAYRWVFDDMEDEQNFLPQYFKNPPRFQKSPPEIVCQAVGLSFFSTEENANQRFQVLTRRMAEKVKYKIGKNIAEGILKKEEIQSFLQLLN